MEGMEDYIYKNGVRGRHVPDLVVGKKYTLYEVVEYRTAGEYKKRLIPYELTFIGYEERFARFRTKAGYETSILYWELWRKLNEMPDKEYK